MPQLTPTIRTILTAVGLTVLLVVVALLCYNVLNDDAPGAADPARRVSIDSAFPAPSLTKDAVQIPGNGTLSLAWVGTVLTAGRGASDQDHTFQAQVDAALDRDHDFSTSTTLGRLASTTDLLSELDDVSTSSLYIIELGDYVSPNLSMADFRQRLSSVVLAVRAASPKGVILCTGQWASTAEAAPYDSVIKRVCEGSGGTFIGLSDVFDTAGAVGRAGRSVYSGHPDAPQATSTASDPTDTGSTAIADKILQVLDVTPAPTP